MKALLFFYFVIVSFITMAQYKSYKILESGDTLNRVDLNNKKVGRWKIHVNALRIEPAFDEEGLFVNNLKEGIWRKYDEYGLLLAKENYKWGMKNGLQQYLSDGRLVREESWRAVDPIKKFDTIDVQDVYDDNKYIQRIFKVESYAQPHGYWKYFDPETGRTLKTENFVLGELFQPQVQQIVPVIDTAVKKTVKPAAVLEYEKSKKNKKTYQVRHGATGG